MIGLLGAPAAALDRLLRRRRLDGHAAHRHRRPCQRRRRRFLLPRPLDLATAALFLVVDMIAERRGADDDALVARPALLQAGVLGALFMFAAVAMAGMPPLSGCIGKLLILDATRDAGAAWVWSVILAPRFSPSSASRAPAARAVWKSAARRPAHTRQRRAYPPRFTTAGAPAALHHRRACSPAMAAASPPSPAP